MEPVKGANDKPAGTSGTAVVMDAEKWKGVIPKFVGTEDAMSPDEVAVVWQKIYTAIGKHSANESEKRQIRAACYVYAVLNGTSRVGQYAAVMRTAGGFSFNAEVIPKATGALMIRRFFRGNMREGYEFLKNSRVMEEYPRFISRCAGLGVPAQCAFATADWLADCPDLTPLEADAHRTAFTFGLKRARGARGGNSLEAVEHSRREEGLRGQGYDDNPNHVQDF